MYLTIQEAVEEMPSPDNVNPMGNQLIRK